MYPLNTKYTYSYPIRCSYNQTPILDNIPLGFKNNRNSCYMDSVLFSLFGIRNLYIEQRINKFVKKPKDCSDIEYIKNEIIKAIKYMHESPKNKTTETCGNLRQMLKKCISEHDQQWNKFQQQDANEFIMWLLNKFDICPITGNEKNVMYNFPPISNADYINEINYSNYIIIGFNRNEFINGKIVKNITKIYVPPYFIKNNIKMVLISVICHTGTFESGHYVSYNLLKERSGNYNWYYYNDLVDIAKPFNDDVNKIYTDNLSGGNITTAIYVPFNNNIPKINFSVKELSQIC